MDDDDLTPDDWVIAQKSVAILLVRGENPDEEPIYAYVAVRADRLEEFMAAQLRGTFYPEDFGVIIEAGEGEPSQEVRRRMRADYGYNEETELNVGDQADARRIVADLDPLAATGDHHDEDEDDNEDED